MITKTLAVEWTYYNPADCRGEVLYWRCGRCEHDVPAPPPCGDPRRDQYIRSGHRPRCWCGTEPEIVLHGLGRTGWAPRLPSWAPRATSTTSTMLFHLKARDVRLDQ